MRSIEVDFLRGVVLIVIALDHVSYGVIQYATLHSYAYCDAAEVFVFLGGYASTSAYAGMAARSGEGAARRRFLKRAWELYRAYVLTAGLMLACGAVLTWLPSQPPLAADRGWQLFAHAPLHTLADIALFREQPFLSAVLPMYVLFALCVPLAVPLARRAPMSLLALSFAVWLVAPWLGHRLPDATGAGWPFNPFAWQLMFVFGMLSRLYPLSADVLSANMVRGLTRAAFLVVLTFAFVKLCVDVHPSPGYLKQNLASVRVISFLSIAWLCAQAAHRGWLRSLATRLPAVVMAGRQGLVCFVGGTLVSMSEETALHLAHVRTTELLTDWPIRLFGDVSAIAAMLVLASMASRLEVARTQPVAIRSSSLVRAPASAHHKPDR
ncbi:MAG TPA: OpgC domain-containing protein [Trinickia sp.]|uniref:OpgC domain-containing protein n=1 Tax=Trinickia sp. TaxID=2571163 RepID=UPI002BBDC744|nr:OpgC domain-containing protein [Trinickia sp.]HTI16504.1 OpgC domain-containing protein [Trinickia sp.]